jgi:SulP family sulfate permease
VSISSGEIVKNITIGVAVSFVAISLGASLGVLSGRGAFAGMIAAGIIPVITSLFGGTRIQCSGPTAPMSAISAVLISYVVSEYDAHLADDQFITLTFLMMSFFLILAAVFRLGRFIAYVPNVVVSGFMSGIALLIWSGQTNVLFGLNGAEGMGGNVMFNVILALFTVVVIFVAPIILKKISARLAMFLPGTLIAIIAVSVVANIFAMPVQHTSLDSSVKDLSDLVSVFQAQIPYGVVFDDIMLALPFALQLTLLCYLDTLLTSLVVDNMTEEKTAQDKELVSQGIANGVAAMFGGIPGAQATIRSVLMVRENATMRLAGVCVGLFVFVEIFLFKDLFSYIPSAVFCGVLIKVGYDVFDWQPFKVYVRQLRKNVVKNASGFVSNIDMMFICGTMLVTLLFDLNAAVLGFTALFYILRRFIRDTQVPDTAEGVSDER